MAQAQLDDTQLVDDALPVDDTIPVDDIPQNEALPEYASILLAADSSDHANQGTLDAVSLANLWGARITATHVYAAKMHDMRFRQMEGGLPEQFRQEDELERQRVVHDDLITRGLSIITDSYLDQVDRICAEQKIDFTRSALEGKNYRELSREGNSGKYDLLIMGAEGLGAIKGSLIGTVCERVARRSEIDTLIIKTPQQGIDKGPIVVAVDGSFYSYGGLLRGIALAKQWQVPLHVISAFDPYYHYVAFNRIAGVLSEEAGKVFRFQEQEQLHEEIIDSGLAKIYDGHLSVAQGIADDYEIEIQTKLLDGKPWDAILKYLKKVDPSLLIVGQTGIHADDELDIGGNTENLMRLCECSILLTRHEHQPRIERLADVTTSWTIEAEQRMKNVPSFVQNMARAAILRYAQEKGHTVITESIVEEATKQLMPGHAEQAMQEIVDAHDAGELKRSVTPQAMQWSDAAQTRLNSIESDSLRSNLKMRAEKKARGDNRYTVEATHIDAFLDDNDASPADNTQDSVENSPLHWQAAALARLSRVPEGFMRDTSKQRIEEYARQQGESQISLSIAEDGLAQSRQAMQSMMEQQNSAESVNTAVSNEKSGSICPFARAAQVRLDEADSNLSTQSTPTKPSQDKSSLAVQAEQPAWSDEAERKMQSVPPGYCRDMTRKAAETIAQNGGVEEIDGGFLQQVLNTFTEGSGEIEETLEWDEAARQRIAKAPEMVRGMLVQEIEVWARNQGRSRVDSDAVDASKQRWEQQGVFHMAPDDPRNKSS